MTRKKKNLENVLVRYDNLILDLIKGVVECLDLHLAMEHNQTENEPSIRHRLLIIRKELELLRLDEE